MGDNNEWHVVQRKKKETKGPVPVNVPNHFVPQRAPLNDSTQRLPYFQNKPQNFQKNNVKSTDFSKSKHNIENNLSRPFVRPVEQIVVHNDQNTNNDITDENYEMVGIGVEITLNYEYVLWLHSIQNNDWSLKGYKKLCSIKNVSEFWKLFNNLHRLNFKNNNFFLMKHNITPIWEDENNRDGGICSLRIEMDHALQVYELLCIFLMCEKLVSNIDDINGISITPKNNWAILKIWNKNKHNKVDRLLHKYILDKYKNVSIQYKQNQPEY